MSISVCNYTYMWLYYMHRGLKRASDSPGAGVKDNCEPPDLNSGPLQK